MSTRTSPTFGLWYDFRNPPQWHQPTAELYRATVEQAVWAEQFGFGSDSGFYRLMDASMAADELVHLATSYPIQDFHYWTQFPGESVESGSERVQYIADKVIPQVTTRLAN